MNFDELMCQRAQREQTAVPEEFSSRVRETLDNLPRNRKKKVFRLWNRTSGMAAAAVLALVFILPNSSAAMASAMAKVPVLGPFFQVITLRTYEDNSEKKQMFIAKPHIVDGQNGTGAKQINAQVEEYIHTLLCQYEESKKEDGYFNLNVTWKVVTNTDRWFTLQIASDLIMATGNHEAQYYHIDVSSGEQQTLPDLFPKDFDYVQVISDELKAQMKARMEKDAREVYWLEGVSELGSYYFNAISPTQDFYFDGKGRIVIPFDKYEVGPGTTGSPEFTLESSALYEHLLVQP